MVRRAVVSTHLDATRPRGGAEGRKAETSVSRYRLQPKLARASGIRSPRRFFYWKNMASASPPRPPERPASCHANMIMSAIVVLVVALKCVDSLSTDPVILQTGHSVDNPLHAACTRDNFMAVWRLIEGGAGIDSTSDDGTGTTGLMLASGFGHVKVVQLLLDRRANVNKVDEEGVTPLMRAAQEAMCQW